MIRGFHDKNYDKEEIYDRIDTDDENIIYLYRKYMFNVVKEYKDIYIEVRSCLDGKLKMIIRFEVFRILECI